MSVTRVRKMTKWTILAALGMTLPACDQSPTEADPSPSPSGEEGVRVPGDIDATGASDVTEALNGFIASVPDSTTIRFPADAKYRIDGTLWIENRHGLSFEGNGATFFTTEPMPYGTTVNRQGETVNDPRNRNRSQWSAKNSSGLIFRDMTVRGANPAGGIEEGAYVSALEAQHGFNLVDVQDVLIEGVRVTDVFGDFVYIGGRQMSRGVTIRDNHFERNGRQGIAITAGEEVLIERNYIGQTRRASIDLEPNNALGGAKRVTIRENTFGPGRLVWIAAGNSLGTIEDLTVENNRLLEGRTMTMHIRPRSGRRARIRVVGNSSAEKAGGSGDGMLYFLNVDGVEVRGNRALLDPRREMTAVATVGSCDVVVAGNDFAGALVEANVQPFDGCAN